MTHLCQGIMECGKAQKSGNFYDENEAGALLSLIQKFSVFDKFSKEDATEWMTAFSVSVSERQGTLPNGINTSSQTQQGEFTTLNTPIRDEDRTTKGKEDPPQMIQGQLQKRQQAIHEFSSNHHQKYILDNKLQNRIQTPRQWAALIYSGHTQKLNIIEDSVTEINDKKYKLHK